uniref:hypothetical protein n=1 Tax=uncultured Dysgonomonas sp. TaxID=206096 RepID=UPI002607AA5B|nr:hypothetical protein [uncultured Dysgonomonas sp.]
MKFSNLLLILLVIFMSCSDDTFNEPSEPTPTPPPVENDPTIPLLFYDSFANISAEYKAVQIGEYLWMNTNINHYPGQPFTKSDIELIFRRYRMNPQALKNISIEDINKYCGPYYDRNRFEYLEDRSKCVIYEGKDKVLNNNWSSASTKDFQQLFAMCGNGGEQDVRLSLTVKAGENPISILGLTYWFGPNNTNKYGFNLMPGGARFNGPQVWELKHNHEGTDNELINVLTGDFYGFTQAAMWQTWDGKVSIDDYPHGDVGKTWHWMPIRWCRKLTDEELGYKLYINQAQTDIKKINLTDPIPEGYKELSNGYIRGFYVQFILNNPNPPKSVSDIVAMAKPLR